jgi:hypothetical protein
MNTIPNSMRAALPAAPNFPTFFLKDARDNLPRKTSGVSAMSYYGKVRTRVPYANALYAAAMAALLSACAPSDVTPASEAVGVESIVEQTDAATADMPTVVITASRERPKAIG